MLLGAVKSVTGVVDSCSSLTDSKGLSSSNSALASSYKSHNDLVSSVALLTLFAMTKPAASATRSRRNMRLVRRRLQTRIATEPRSRLVITLPAASID